MLFDMSRCVFARSAFFGVALFLRTEKSVSGHITVLYSTTKCLYDSLQIMTKFNILDKTDIETIII